MRFTNTFQSSVIPGQEREITKLENLRDVKLYEQDKDLYVKQRAAVTAPSKERAKSAVPSRTSHSKDFKPLTKNFVQEMFGGKGRVRNNNTFKSQVLPMSVSTPDLNYQSETGNKWKVRRENVIYEKKKDDLKK